MRRRNFLVALGASVVAGCDAVGDSSWFGKVVDRAQNWHRGLHRALGVGLIAMAPEFIRSAISPFFSGNGTQSIDTGTYRAAMEDGFANWTVTVSGLVEHPLELSMENLRGLPLRPRQVVEDEIQEKYRAMRGK